MYTKSMMQATLLLVVMVLCAVHQSQADQLPVKSRLLRIPARLLPHIIHRRTTVPPASTPSMIDQNWNFTKPSDFAKNCINAIGKSIVGVCQANATRDYDPSRIGTSTSTVWESCCSIFEELDCYVKNAATFCPSSTDQAVIKYSKRVGDYFQKSICQSVSFDNWKFSCDNATHAAIAAQHQKAHNNDPNSSPSFVNLPKDDGPESACFKNLRTKTSVNLEQKCLNASLAKYDPTNSKLVDAGVVDACCAIYDSLDCLQGEAKNVCTGQEQSDLGSYRKKSLVAFSQSICKAVPYEQVGSLCKASGSYAVLPSMFTMLAAILLFARVHF